MTNTLLLLATFSSIMALANLANARTCPDILSADSYHQAGSFHRPMTSAEVSEVYLMVVSNPAFEPYGTLLHPDLTSTYDSYLIMRAIHELTRCGDSRPKTLLLSARLHRLNLPIPAVSRLTVQGAGIGLTVISNERPSMTLGEELKRVVFLSGSTHPQMLQNRNDNSTPLSTYPTQLKIRSGERVISMVNRIGDFSNLKPGSILHLADPDANTENAGLLPYVQEVVEVARVSGEFVTLAAPVKKNYTSATLRLMGTGGIKTRNRRSQWFMERDIAIRDLSTRGQALMQESGFLRGRIENVRHVGFKGITVNLVKDLTIESVTVVVNWRGIELKGMCDSVLLSNSRIVGNDQASSLVPTVGTSTGLEQRPLLSTGERCRNIRIVNQQVIEGRDFFLTNKMWFSGESIEIDGLMYYAKSAGRFMYFVADQDTSIQAKNVRLKFDPDPRYDGTISVLKASSIGDEVHRLTGSLLDSTYNRLPIPDGLIQIIQSSTPNNVTLLRN